MFEHIFLEETNSWMQSSRNIRYENNILEAELRACNGDWRYNKLEIHPLLLNKNLMNNDGIFKYNLSSEENDEIMGQFYPLYSGETIPFINIKKCTMLSVSLPKYNDIRNDTISILNNYKLPPFSVFFGYTKEMVEKSKFYDLLQNKNQRNELTLGMLEIFENFVNKSENDNEWLLFFEDDVRPVNIDVNEDLTKLYNVPLDAELIRPYIGKNEQCNLQDVKYNVSFNGGLNHALYISSGGCKKVLNYARKYQWKYICDIDIYKIARGCSGFPTGYDCWSLDSCNGNNDISWRLEEHEKINTYHLSHVIFNQTSNWI